MLVMFVLLLFLTNTHQSNLHHQLVISILNFYKPSLTVFLTCWKKQEKLELHKIILRQSFDIGVVFCNAKKGSIGKIKTKNFEKVSYFLDMDCEESESILHEASEFEKFGKFEFLYSWYILVKQQQKNLTDILETFKRFKTRMDMEVKVIYFKVSHRIKMFEIFNPGINSEIKVRYVGNYSDGILIWKKGKSYYQRRKNMTGVLIRSANVIRYPFNTSFHEYMTDLKLRRFDIYSKFHYQMFLVLKGIHGFSYNTTLPSSWFGNTSSGEDGGIAKMLWDDTADISSAGCILRLLGTDRMDFYDFIMPYYKFRSCFYFRNPGVVKPNFNEVLKPFAKTAWYATLYITLIVCVCIEVAYLVEKGDSNSREYTGNSSWLMSVFAVVAVFAQQGLDTIPKHLSGRIILLHLLILSVLLYNYYTSSLVSSLISTEPEVLKTIRELYESQLKVGIELQPYTITYMLDRSKEDYYLRVLNSTKLFEHGEPNFLSVDDGIKKVHQGDFAYHTESITAYPMIAKTFEQESICDLAEITLINSDTSLMAQKKSQYKKLFQISLRKMWQSGILQKLYKTWVGSKPECLSSARVISVGVNDLFLPYFLLALGVVTSLFILGAELVWTRLRLKYMRKTIKSEDVVYPIIYVN